MILPILLLSVCPLAAERTLTLKQALEEAAKLNPDIQLARLRTLEAEAGTRAVKSAYQPQLSATVTAAYQTINLQGIGLFIPGFSDRIGPFRTFNARPVLTQTVLDLSLLSRIKAAREREGEFRFNIQAARDATQLAVVQIYLQIQQSESRIAAAEARLATARALLTQARDFNAAGTASKLDVARTEQQFFSEEAALTQARRDRDFLMAALVRTIGIEEPVALESPAANIKPAEPATLNAALDRRPELKALDARLRTNDLERQAAERQRLPKLSFVGDYGVSGAGPDRALSTYAVGATLSIPIFTGGRIESEVRAARIRADQTRAERKAAELRIAQELAQAQIDLSAAAATLGSAQHASAAAREALELAKLRFGAGIATSVDTTVAQGRLAEAEDFEIRTRYEHHIARARLAYALGDVASFAE